MTAGGESVGGDRGAGDRGAGIPRAPRLPRSTRLWGVGVVAILAGIATMSGVLLLAFAIFTALVITPVGAPAGSP